MNIIGHKYIFLTVSVVLVAVSFIAIGLWGLKLGIDFTGGSLLEIEYTKERPETGAMKDAVIALAGATILQPAGERGVIFRFSHIDEALHRQVISRLQEFGAGVEGNEVLERRFDSIGPTIGAELRRRSLLALGLAIAAIVVYIAWAFRKVSKPIASWKYGIVAIAALVHDVAVPTGIFAVLGHYGGVEVDALFITALLTILGFSVHDTIVVFDRIRENLRKLKGGETFALTVNRSIQETIARSINTSLTVFLVLGIIFFLGGETTRWFSLALISGIFFGTYSSIFIASPLVVLWNERSEKSK